MSIWGIDAECGIPIIGRAKIDVNYDQIVVYVPTGTEPLSMARDVALRVSCRGIAVLCASRFDDVVLRVRWRLGKLGGGHLRGGCKRDYSREAAKNESVVHNYLPSMWEMCAISY